MPDTTTTRPDLHDQVEGLLGQLGAEAGEIADTLQHLGITGQPDDSHACPIANYLTGRLDGDHDVNVCEEEVTVDFHTYVDTPHAVAEFVVTFDQGSYSQLIARPAVAR